MSKETGGPAFPCLEATVTGIDSDGQERIDTEAHGGMTLRDYFAAKALQGLAAHVVGAAKHSNETGPQAHARLAYAYADAMIAERAK
jgi:hypothetical protein